MLERIDISSLTDIGSRRNKNEDAALAVKFNGGVLLMVADGIGGHRKGEVASDMALSIIQERVVHYEKQLTISRAKKLIKSAIKSANKEINELSTRPDYLDMGTTLVLALVLEEGTLIANCGDSRLYTYKHGRGVQQQTVDHTFVEYMVRNGKMTREEAEKSPKKNVLLNALGTNPGIFYDEQVIKNDYDSLLLCSDGLYNMVNIKELNEVMGKNQSTSSKVKDLISLANTNGGLDNIGVSLMEVL